MDGSTATWLEPFLVGLSRRAAALLPETELTIGVTRLTNDPLDLTEGHYSVIP